MKKIIILICLALALTLTLSMCGGKEKEVTITVAEGSSVYTVAQALKENDLIWSKFVFARKVESTDGYILPGLYTFKTGTSMDEIIKVLKAGNKEETITLTVPEGFSAEMIASRVQGLGICTEQEFLQAADTTDYDFAFLKNVKPNSNVKYKLQGFLYPNTYYIPANASAADVVKILLAEFEKQLNRAELSYDNLYEAVTVASLLQREALVESEKSTIAGVIYNRLENNMPLQIDAAVVYAVTDGAYNINAVYNKDLKVDSPYNIYKHQGLTPGPICNPDIASIKAAISPEKHDYLYYRTDEKKNDGSHIFTKTFNEHLNANN